MQDLRLCELLAARICHDLVGPVGAVANGVELMGEDGAGADAEVIRLISGSAQVASRRLQAFRVAFGSANTLPSAGWLGAVRELALGLVEEGKSTVEWPAVVSNVEAVSDKRLAKILLNLVMIALDSMIRPGVIRVGVTNIDRSVSIVVNGIGGQGRIPDEVRAGLEGVFDLAKATPKAAPAYLTASLARELGGVLAVSADSVPEFEIRAAIPYRS